MTVVLVVEDNLSQQRALRRLLEVHDVRTVAADCFEAARQVLDSERHLDGAVVDVGLPDRSGLDLLPLLCVARVPTMVLTGLASEEILVHSQALGARYVSKGLRQDAQLRAFVCSLPSWCRERAARELGRVRRLTPTAVERLGQGSSQTKRDDEVSAEIAAKLPGQTLAELLAEIEEQAEAMRVGNIERAATTLAWAQRGEPLLDEQEMVSATRKALRAFHDDARLARCALARRTRVCEGVHPQAIPRASPAGTGWFRQCGKKRTARADPR